MKRIGIVCDGYWDQLQGGAEYQLYLLAHELQRRGYSVHYLYVDKGTPIESTPVSLHPLRLPKVVRKIFHPYHFLLYPQLRRTLDDIGVDLIINRVANAMVGICAQYAQQRGIVNCWQIANETDLMAWRNPRNRTILTSYLDKLLSDYGARHSTFVTTQAEYQSDMLLRHFGRQSDLLLKNFHPLPESSPAKPISCAEKGTKKIVWIANIKAKKQPYLFIDLAKSFSDHPHLHFIMVGRLEHEHERGRFMEAVKSTENLSYRGEVSIGEVNELLASAAIFVNTSYFEGFPNTFIQAWMRKVPVVSLFLDPDDILKKKGIGFHSRSFEQMLKDVQILVDNDKLRTEMGNVSRAYAMAEHQLGPNVDKFDSFIQEITG